VLPVILIGAFFFFMMRQAQGTNNQAMSLAEPRPDVPGQRAVVTFADVAGSRRPRG
jgi:cell division protease FtsH